MALIFDFSAFTNYRLFRSWPARDDPSSGPFVWGPFNGLRGNSILDVNGDGLNDIILFPSYFDTGPHIDPILLLNDGRGGWSKQTISIPGFVPENINGDWTFRWKGDQYLVAPDQGYEGPGNFHGSRIWLLKYDTGTKTLEDVSDLIPGNVNNFNHISWFGDLDGNGKLDVVVPVLGGPRLPGDGIRWIEFGDTVTDRSSELYSAIAYSTYASRAGNPAVHASIGGVGVGDLNGDGFNELVAISYRQDIGSGTDPKVRILFGSGQGFSQQPLLIDAPTFVKTTPYFRDDPSSGPLGGMQALVTDVNGDGKNDLIVVWEGWAVSYVQVLLNQSDQLVDRTSDLFGDLAVRDTVQKDSQGNFVFNFLQAEVVDFNRDGSPDLYFRTFSASTTGMAAALPQQSFLWQNDGTGHYQPAHLVPASAQSAVANIVNETAWENYQIGYPMYGDVTGDGVPDLVTLTVSHPDATTIAGSLYSNFVDLVTVPGVLATTVVARGDAYIVKQGQAPTQPLSTGVLANDEHAATASLLDGPDHGTLQLVGNGTFTYTPAAGFHGVDTFTYQAGNAGLTMDEAQVTIHVVPVSAGSQPTLELVGLTAEEQIAATYVAFFGRGADKGGFGFWVDQFVTNLPTQGPSAVFANIASSFAISAEAKALYPFLVDPFHASDSQINAFLNSVYDNLFNRTPDAGGLGYWTGQVKQTLQANQFVGSVLVNIMSGAQDTSAGKDITTLMGKVAVSLAYVREQQEHATGWLPSDNATATTLLETVTADPASVLVGVRNAESLIASHA